MWTIVSPSIIIQVKAWGSTATQDIPHPHDKDVFEELDTSHGSSWQYELQQLKIANQRSYEELKVLGPTLRRYTFVFFSWMYTTAFTRCEG